MQCSRAFALRDVESSWLEQSSEGQFCVRGRRENSTLLEGSQDSAMRCGPYRAVNTLRLGYTNQSVNVVREIMAVCSEIHTKHINTAVWAERRVAEC